MEGFDVLVIEDEESRRKMFRENLNRHPLFMSDATSGILAVRLKRYDYIFLDHDLGMANELTGYDVACSMYLSVNRYTPVLIHSANIIGVKNITGVLDDLGIPSEVFCIFDKGFWEAANEFIGEKRDTGISKKDT